LAAAFEAALKFAKTDKRGGAQTMLNHHGVSDPLMGITIKTDAVRLSTLKAAHALDTGFVRDLGLEAKIYCSNNAVEFVSDVMSNGSVACRQFKSC
jgi:alkylation response protein AidB-like acyl-CoA dehydrogenase